MTFQDVPKEGRGRGKDAALMKGKSTDDRFRKAHSNRRKACATIIRDILPDSKGEEGGSRWIDHMTRHERERERGRRRDVMTKT